MLIFFDYFYPTILQRTQFFSKEGVIEYKNLFNKTPTGLFIGKYESLYNNFTKIYDHRLNKKFNNNFIILNVAIL